jgi:integrase
MMLRDFLGADRPLEAIGKREVGDFKMLLERLPPTHGKSVADRGRTLEEIAAVADVGGAPRLGARTIKRHLTAISGLFTWAKEHGRYERDNPARGFTFPRTRRPRDERPAWTGRDLEKLFRSPIWTGCAGALDRQRHVSGPDVIRDHRYWLPLIGAYAGLRLEEACQLLVEDIGTEDGIAFIHVRPGEGKQLKSKAAVRRVPVHLVLIEAGLMRHVQEAKGRGDVRLFPALKPGGPDKRFGYAESKRFTAYRRQIGCGGQGQDFHALRHSFTTTLVAADVSRAIIDELTGHEGAGETSRYTKGLPLAVLQEAVARLDYGFDTSHLRVP